VTASYIAVRYPALSDLVSRRPWDGLLAPSVILALFVEGLRRTSGMPLVVTTVGFFILALVGGLLPGDLAARSIPLEATEIGRWINIAGACMAVALLIQERGTRRKPAPARG
jgi:TRAP-type uncharacterized transport system fused permease subunit